MTHETMEVDPCECCELCGTDDDVLEYAFDPDGRMLLVCGACRTKVDEEVNRRAAS